MPAIKHSVTGEGAPPVIVLNGSGDQITSFGGDLTSVVPGTGATNLGKAIDVAAGVSDVGVALLAMRDDALSSITPADGDWAQLRVDANGALWVQLAGALSPSTDGIYLGASTSGGMSVYKMLDLDEGTAEVVKASAAKLYGYAITNLHTATVYVHIYDRTSATTGTHTPAETIAIPASTGIVLPPTGAGITYATGLCISASLGVGDADNTAIPSANLVVGSVFYK